MLMIMANYRTPRFEGYFFAKRLESVLPSTIHFNQCAYVKGRTICDAVKTIDDILDYTEKSKINGRMIAIDFRKAFDSLSREFFGGPEF